MKCVQVLGNFIAEILLADAQSNFYFDSIVISAEVIGISIFRSLEKSDRKALLIQSQKSIGQRIST